MMKSSHIGEQLSAYLDNAVSVEEKMSIEEHLEACNQCSLLLNELKKSRDILHDLDEVEPPPWFTQKIMNCVREEAEPKKGIFQTLFYPLHIKIPAEVLGTCLVTVLALFVYKNTGLETKTLHEPGQTAVTTSKNQAEKQYDGSLSPAREKDGQSNGILKGSAEQQKIKTIPVLPDNRGTGGLAKEAQSPAVSPSESQVAKKDLGESEIRYGRGKQERVPSPISSATTNVGEKTITHSPGGIQASSVIEPNHFSFTVFTNTLETTIGETENLLNRFNAKNIKKSSRQVRSVLLNADLPGQKVKEFFNELKKLGYVKERETPDNRQQGYTAVSIEITANP